MNIVRGVCLAPQQDIKEYSPPSAAADHCLGAAYQGLCPGVDPDELMQWRVESRAKFQDREVLRAVFYN